MSERASTRPPIRPPPVTSREEEAQAKERFRDALFSLLAAAGRRPERTPVCHAVEALMEWYVEAPITVVWALVDRTTNSRLYEAGATCQNLGDDAEPLTGAAVARELAAWNEGPAPPDMSPRARYYAETDAGRLQIVRRVGPVVEERLIVVLTPEPRDDAAAVRRAWLETYDQGLRELVTTLQALHALDRQAELEREVDALGFERSDAPFERRLHRATHLLDRLNAIRAPEPQPWELELLDRVAFRVVQDALGTGWLDRLDTSHRERPIRTFARGLLRAADDLGPAQATRLRLLALTLDAQPDVTRASKAEPGLRSLRASLDGLRPDPQRQDPALWLLAAWTGAHRAIARLAESPGLAHAEHEALWTWLREQTTGSLVTLLAQGGGALDRERLALWFALRLMPALDGPGNPQRWLLRTSLAWVVREAVRQILCSQRADYVWQPERFARALLDLVELHALEVLGLGNRLDVRGALTLMGGGHNRRDLPLGSSHRQHVLDVYLGAHFLLDLERVDADGATVHVDQLLAEGDRLPDATPGCTVRELRCAMSVAVLYHDLGLLLLDRLHGAEPWPELLPLPRELHSLLLSRRQEDVRTFRDRCLADLRAAHVVGEISDENARYVDHGVVGAWMLLHLAQDAGLEDGVARRAIRAVLLHGDAAMPVDITTDPVAAVLLLCDQLFEWEPAMESNPDVGALGADRRVLAPWAGRRPSRAARVVLDGLKISADGDGARAVVEGGAAWPGVTIELHHPEVSGVSTWQVWLTIAQHLGRIRARAAETGAPVGWSPRIRVSAPLPGWMHEHGLDTHALLEQAVWKEVPPALRALVLSLRGWLNLRDRFSRREGPPLELLELHALRHDRDVRLDYPLLHEVIEALERPEGRRG